MSKGREVGGGRPAKTRKRLPLKMSVRGFAPTSGSPNMSLAFRGWSGTMWRKPNRPQTSLRAPTAAGGGSALPRSPAAQLALLGPALPHPDILLPIRTVPPVATTGCLLPGTRGAQHLLEQASLVEQC